VAPPTISNHRFNIGIEGMAQSYFPVRQFSASPAPLTPTLEKEKQFDAEEVQEVFVEQKNKCVLEFIFGGDA